MTIKYRNGKLLIELLKNKFQKYEKIYITFIITYY